MSAMVEPILHFLTIIRETRGGLRLLHSAINIIHIFKILY